MIVPTFVAATTLCLALFLVFFSCVLWLEERVHGFDPAQKPRRIRLLPSFFRSLLRQRIRVQNTPFMIADFVAIPAIALLVSMAFGAGGGAIVTLIAHFSSTASSSQVFLTSGGAVMLLYLSFTVPDMFGDIVIIERRKRKFEQQQLEESSW